MHVEGDANMDEWKERTQQDMNAIKNNQSQQNSEIINIKTDIVSLQTSEKLQDIEIANVKETMSEIRDDTRWIRRKITGAVIMSVVGLIITGVLGFIISQFLEGIL